MAFTNAFKCADCPESSGAKGCPGWWTTIWSTPGGTEEIINACCFQQMQRYFIEIVKASNRPAAAVESLRNEMLTGLGVMAGAIQVFGQGRDQQLLTAPGEEHEKS